MKILKNDKGSIESISNIPFLIYIILGMIALFIFYEAVFVGYRYYFVSSYMDQLAEIYTVSNYSGTNLRELDSVLDTNNTNHIFFGKIDRSDYVSDHFELLMENLSILPTDWNFVVKEVNDKYDNGGEGIKFLVLEVRLKSFFMPKMFVENSDSYNSEFVDSYYTDELEGKAHIEFIRAFSHKSEFTD